MAYRCQQYNLFTRLLSVLQWHSPQTRSFSSPVIACHLSIWQPRMEHVPAVRFPPPLLGRDLGGAAAGIAAAILFRHKGPQQPNFHDYEEEEDNRSYPEDEEAVTNPTKKRKND